MTTLEAIGFNLAAGAGLGTLTLAAFGVAVRMRHEYIAPKCTARPKNVIYNPQSASGDLENDNNCYPQQDRGNPWTGWIPWTLNLTYDTILQGVPGTGTRQGGMAGSLLRGNLDAIVLLRFHAVGAKVSALATLLSIVILLPMYWTGQCAQQMARDNVSEEWQTACATSTYNLTNYEQTTLANVPGSLVEDGGGGNGTLDELHKESRVRLYFCVFCFWIMSGYLLYLLKREWIEILALRRVYYLEANVWGERCDELHELELYKSDQQRLYETFDTKKAELPPPMALQRERERRTSVQEQDERRLMVRDPWIPHPEHRDTVPNVQLYSVLVGGLPSLPEPQGEEDEEQAHHVGTSSKRDTMDWQLALTAAFFDHCVPNQPGFSSSVAAVTILPSSKSVSMAWKKWYIAAAKLRRLRFIRAQMARKYHEEMLRVLPPPSSPAASATSNQNHSNQNSPLPAAPQQETQERYSGDDDHDFSDSDKFCDEKEHSQGDLLFEKGAGGVDEQGIEIEDQDSAIPPAAVDQEISSNHKNITERTNSFSQLRPTNGGGSSSHHESVQQLKDYYDSLLREEPDVVVPAPGNDDDDDDANNEQDEFDSGLHVVEDDGEQGQHHHTNQPKPHHVVDHEHRVHALLINHTFGPEQTAVYSREFAQSAAPCCPNGCFEDTVRNSSLEELRDMEQEAAQAVLHANKELWLEQQQVRQARAIRSVTNHEFDQQQQQNEADEVENTLQEQDHEADDSNDNVVVAHKDEEDFAEQDVETGLPADSMRPETNNAEQQKPLKQRHKSRTKNLPKELALEERLYKNKAPVTNSSHQQHSQQQAASSGSMRHAGSGIWSRNMSKWDKVKTIVSLTHRDLSYGNDNINRRQTNPGQKPKKAKHAISGRWNWPSWRDVLGKTRDTGFEMTDFVATQTKDWMDLSLESQHAIVTFTSRQAAVAARQCLADGRASGRWRTVQELAIPPLSDAAACDVFVFRNCCRPVTMSIDEGQQNRRSYIVFLLLAGFYFFSPFLLSLFAAILHPQALEDTLPKLFRWLQERFGEGTSETVSGFMQSTLYTIFFALCPVFFKALANFGSRASSVANAELAALQYFWWFMVVSAFSGTLIANMFLFGFNDGISGGELKTVLLSIARAVPSSQGATWLNWIVLRTTFVITAQYLFQLPTFLWALFGMKCCSRLSRGGGAGPPTPYRLYVDSGVVLLCLLSLAPASPLVAPAAFFYFLWTQPVLRRCILFVYRPKYDGGGFRYPFIFLIAISSVLVGQILLTLQMVLKQAPGPAVLAAVPILGTLLFSRSMKAKFLPPFTDAALLQTSLLDGWDLRHTDTATIESREEFRKFLVDSHKAAYVPVCLAGGDDKENSLTAEPAVVVPLETDLIKDLRQQNEQQHHEQQPPHDDQAETDPLLPPKMAPEQSLERISPPAGVLGSGAQTQHGAVLRRAVQTISAMNHLQQPCKYSGR